jgi:hypothetical protein
VGRWPSLRPCRSWVWDWWIRLAGERERPACLAQDVELLFTSYFGMTEVSVLASSVVASEVTELFRSMGR